MALQMGALRDALEAAGAPSDKAVKAAEEMAGTETRFAKLEAESGILKWMMGAVIALVLPVLGKQFGVVG